jgi:hypothetical protein
MIKKNKYQLITIGKLGNKFTKPPSARLSDHYKEMLITNALQTEVGKAALAEAIEEPERYKKELARRLKDPTELAKYSKKGIEVIKKIIGQK